MPAVIFSGRYVIGFHQNPDLEEMARLGTNYDIVGEIPTTILSVPEGFYIERVAEGEYVQIVIPVPEVPKTAEQLRIEQLEADNADLWYENMIQSAKVEANETEVSALWYELMMGGI